MPDHSRVPDHFHADFIAGHLELRDREQTTIHLGSRAVAEYPFTPLGDGEEVRVGRIRLVVLETPGHSPESISILVFDPEVGEDVPHAVLTGDTLFIGDCGRPDLRASFGWSAEQLASMLYDSLHQKLAALPDETLVYPAHGAGSLCGKSLSTETVSNMGAQRRYVPQTGRIYKITDVPKRPRRGAKSAICGVRDAADPQRSRAIRPLGRLGDVFSTRRSVKCMPAGSSSGSVTASGAAIADLREVCRG